MVLVISLKEKFFRGEKFPDGMDPLGGSDGVEIWVAQRCGCAFGLPFWGTRKMAKAYSVATGEQIPVLLWTDGMKEAADKLIRQTKGAWKNRILGQIILLTFLGLILWLLLSIVIHQNDKTRQASYRENPEIGDVILAEVTPSTYVERGVLASLKVFRIEDLRGDSLVVVRSKQSKELMDLYRMNNKEKLTGLFDTSQEAFAESPEVYSLNHYRQGEGRLVRILREGLTEEESLKQDSLINYTDKIQPIYVKRLKNNSL